MAIIVNLDVMMAKRKMSLNELSEKIDLKQLDDSNIENSNLIVFRLTI